MVSSLDAVILLFFSINNLRSRAVSKHMAQSVLRYTCIPHVLQQAARPTELATRLDHIGTRGLDRLTCVGRATGPTAILIKNHKAAAVHIYNTTA